MTRDDMTFILLGRSGGNQREMDRARAQKKATKSKPKESNANLAKRRENDAEILRAKQKVREDISFREEDKAFIFRL
ncbi:hypothetical protein BGW80DRAFT_1262063 [Lactifluus volemus]|nr:hypothetical protein BGW80DRAFT_1262063 [Lactifluus volemus]